MAPDVKVVAYFSMQLQDSSEYQLAAIRRFSKYRDKQLDIVKDRLTHKGSRPQSQLFDISLYIG